VADNKTGYFGVQIARPGQPKPYQARVRRGGKYVYLGCFVTAEEAALCVARSPKGQAVAAERAAAAATLTNQPRSSGYRRTTCCVSPQLLQPELPIVFLVFQQLCCTTIAVFHHNCCVSPQLLCFTTIAVFHHNCCVSISVRWIHSIVEAATATRSRRCRNASFPAGVES
jgi:hypothetical protein